jgi:hypothetical protein
MSGVLSEAERFVNLDEPVIAREVVQERVDSAAAAVRRETSRSSALESTIAGGLIVGGTALEIGLGGEVSTIATTTGALAGLAPWLVARARRRLSRQSRGQSLLRDYLIGLAST